MCWVRCVADLFPPYLTQVCVCACARILVWTTSFWKVVFLMLRKEDFSLGLYPIKQSKWMDFFVVQKHNRNLVFPACFFNLFWTKHGFAVPHTLLETRISECWKGVSEHKNVFVVGARVSWSNTIISVIHNFIIITLVRYRQESNLRTHG